MKIFIYIILGLAAALLVFNLTQIDYSQPFTGDSKIAAISVLACACAILLLVILIISKKIENKEN